MKQVDIDNKNLAIMRERMNAINETCQNIDTDANSLKKKLTSLSKYTEVPPILNIENKIISKKSSPPPPAPIFITARFRTGSSFLWNFFRSIPQITAFYEPLQENLPEHIERQTPAQDSHVGVHSYWEEYSQLYPEIKKMHHAEFGFKKLLLESDDQYKDLKQFITLLIESTNGKKTPVLQFNRVDFRLPWLKTQFPRAKIIHLYRNPRDQWFSMVKEHAAHDVTHADINTNYDLLLWSIYLAKYFPFLTDSIKSSYERHYYIWKLSELMGKRCADISINFDQDIQLSPKVALKKIKTVVDINGYEEQFLLNITPGQSGNWESIRPKKWYKNIELQCNNKLKSLGLIDYFATKPLPQIIKSFSSSWENISPETTDSLQERTIALLLTTRGSIIKINKDLDTIVANSNVVAINSQKVVEKYIEERNLQETISADRNHNEN